MASKKSTLSGQGQALLNAGQKYDVDPRLIVAIAEAETSFGKNITWGQFNAWNYGWNSQNRQNSPFSSWTSGINTVTKSIGGRNYLQANPPLTNTSSIYGRYCQGPDCVNGLNNINAFLKQQGGAPNSLHFPCP